MHNYQCTINNSQFIISVIVHCALIIVHYLSFIVRKARANWSGHDVPLPLQLMPVRRVMTSSVFIPSTSRATACALPWQPPVNSTCFTVSPSTVMSILREHTPVGVKLMLCIIELCKMEV